MVRERDHGVGRMEGRTREHVDERNETSSNFLFLTYLSAMVMGRENWSPHGGVRTTWFQFHFVPCFKLPHVWFKGRGSSWVLALLQPFSDRSCLSLVHLPVIMPIPMEASMLRAWSSTSVYA